MGALLGCGVVEDTGSWLMYTGCGGISEVRMIEARARGGVLVVLEVAVVEVGAAES